MVGETEADADDARPFYDLPLVGREEELGLLERAWTHAKAARGQVGLIQGDAGVGKSRLIDALRGAVGDEPHLWVTIRCSPYHANSPLHPLIKHLRRVLRWSSDDDDATRLAKLEAALGRQSQPLGEIVPLVGTLLSLPLPEDRYPKLTLEPKQLREQIQDAVLGWLLDEAERSPVLIVWEDLHWADPTTLELVGLFIDQSPTVAILNLLTYRPEFVPPWPTRSHVTPLTLNRLERPEVKVLIGHLAKGKSLPDAVTEHIVDKADGVPLYVEELTKTLLEQPILVERDDAYVLNGPLSDLEIPATLQDSLMARLDRAPSLRQVAQVGAVIGREFAYEMVNALSAMREAELGAALGQLVENELLYQRGRPPRARYIFKHALIQDAAYHSLLNRTRQSYHLELAKLIESRFPAIAQGSPELVAYHYTEGGAAHEAVAHWQLGGSWP